MHVTEDTLNYTHVGELMLSDLIKLQENHPDKIIIQVCAPILTGGRGSIKANLEFLESAIKTINAQKYLLPEMSYREQLQEEQINILTSESGCIVFDQSPYEHFIFTIKNNRRKKDLWVDYDYAILEECYRPLFESGIFDALIFLPGYASSTGAMIEMGMAEKLKVPIYLWNQLCLSL